jgi:hypothetical protein
MTHKRKQQQQHHQQQQPIIAKQCNGFFMPDMTSLLCNTQEAAAAAIKVGDLYEANRWLTQALELNHHTFQVGSVHMPKYVCTCVHCVDAKRVCMCVHCEDTKCVCMCVHCVDKSRVCMCVYVYVCDKMFREFRWSQIN